MHPWSASPARLPFTTLVFAVGFVWLLGPVRGVALTALLLVGDLLRERENRRALGSGKLSDHAGPSPILRGLVVLVVLMLAPVAWTWPPSVLQLGQLLVFVAAVGGCFAVVRPSWAPVGWLVPGALLLVPPIVFAFFAAPPAAGLWDRTDLVRPGLEPLPWIAGLSWGQALTSGVVAAITASLALTVLALGDVRRPRLAAGFALALLAAPQSPRPLLILACALLADLVLTGAADPNARPLRSERGWRATAAFYSLLGAGLVLSLFLAVSLVGGLPGTGRGLHHTVAVWLGAAKDGVAGTLDARRGLDVPAEARETMAERHANEGPLKPLRPVPLTGEAGAGGLSPEQLAEEAERRARTEPRPDKDAPPPGSVDAMDAVAETPPEGAAGVSRPEELGLIDPTRASESAAPESEPPPAEVVLREPSPNAPMPPDPEPGSVSESATDSAAVAEKSTETMDENTAEARGAEVAVAMEPPVAAAERTAPDAAQAVTPNSESKPKRDAGPETEAPASSPVKEPEAEGALVEGREVVAGEGPGASRRVTTVVTAAPPREAAPAPGAADFSSPSSGAGDAGRPPVEGLGRLSRLWLIALVLPFAVFLWASRAWWKRRRGDKRGGAVGAAAVVDGRRMRAGWALAEVERLARLPSALSFTALLEALGERALVLRYDVDFDDAEATRLAREVKAVADQIDAAERERARVERIAAARAARQNRSL